MPYVSGWLIEGADPGFGNRPSSPPGIDNSLPGSQPGIDNALPPAPVFPPPTVANPIVPIPPGTSVPPGTIWPPVFGGPRPGHDLPSGGYPSHGLPDSPGHPDQGLPPSPGHPDQGLPSGGGEVTNPIQPKTYWMIAYCPSLGWKYVAVDPSLRPGTPLPPHTEPKG